MAPGKFCQQGGVVPGLYDLVNCLVSCESLERFENVRSLESLIFLNSLDNLDILQSCWDLDSLEHLESL